MSARTDSLYVSAPCERYTPFSLARKIGAKVILESASFARGKQRYSILMTEEAFHIVQDDDGIAFLIDGRRVPFTQAADAAETVARGSSKPHQTDILDALLYVAQQNDLSTVTDERGERVPNAIPVPASGIGYLGYEF